MIIFAEGLLCVDQLVSLKIQGVTPEFIQQTKALGFNLNTDQLTAFRTGRTKTHPINDIVETRFEQLQ